MRRPAILLRAARTVAARLTCNPVEGDCEIAAREAEYEAARRGRAGGYNAERHVAVLARLIALQHEGA